MDIITSGVEVPPGVILFEDPPLHDLHRRLLSKVFTPRRMDEIEPLTRQLCRARSTPCRCRGLRLHRRSRCADPDAHDRLPAGHSGGRARKPFAEPPMTQSVRTTAIAHVVAADAFVQAYLRFVEYIDWRAEHPSDDLMTQLLNAEIEESTACAGD